jgi:hypothetical protein
MSPNLFDSPTNPEPFDDMPAPAQRHSPTSVDAAEQIEPRAATLRRHVFMLLSMKGMYGATDEEMQNDLNMNGSTQRPRRVELLQAGLIRDSGRTRRTRSGRAAVVWVVT